MAQKFPWQVVKLIIESAMSNGITFKDLPKNIALFDRLVKRQGVTSDDLERLMDGLEKATGRTDLSIIFAKTFIPESIDDYLTLAYTAKNLHQAVQLLSKYKWILHPSVDLVVEEYDDLAAITYRSSDGFPIGDKYFYSEGLFSCIYHRVKDVTGVQFTPEKIHFRHPITPHHDLYSEYFDCPVYHDQEWDSIFLKKEVLYLPFNTHDEEASLLIQQKAQDKCNKPTTFVKEVNQAMVKHLSNDEFCIEDLAFHMNMSRRSLQRKLKEFGLTFSELKNNLRINRAKKTLFDGQVSVDHLAEQLGFINSHSFRQFFKKHTGMTVSQYKSTSFVSEHLH